MATLLGPRASCLRSFTPSTQALASSAKAQVATFSTLPTKQPLTQLRLPARPTSRPSIVCRVPPQTFTFPAAALRHNSSSSSSSSSPNPPPSAAQSPTDILTWNRFFDLRKKRRFINLGASVITSAAALFTFGPVVAAQDLDSWGAQISGLDPFIVLGMSGIIIAGGGWLCGPSVGSGMFSLWAKRRGWSQAIAEKEKIFYARIKKHRADPASSSPQNPIPDYYGEKIGSVKDYRRWLKDQRAFNLKKNKNLI
ncbi:hypothetical protein D0869_08336 [Hortaea werneckii]|uniref:Presequence translocated-associated motor subunit PAM17 n=1 Tax=Hortaea werneckii TaxID=91943 RepID=A0A3M6YGU6_HORWE|nr:hypothetical protein D0869_08336 [Hortaea werneckii]RMY02082.1 hypothetical protein D0868_08148 [Hortaea werneckii]